MQDLTGCVILHSYRMGTSIQNLPEQEVFWKSVWGNLRNAVVGCSAAVLFGLAVLLMSILSVTNPQKVFPQNIATVSAEIYYLPYPGVLPDSPMYKFKAVRDWVQLWLIFDPVQKAHRELLYADKRVNAAKALVEGGKGELGVSTASKGEKYLERSVDTTVGLQKSGKDVKSLLLTLANATAKHGELLQQLMSNIQGADRQSLEASLKLTHSLQEKVTQALRE